MNNEITIVKFEIEYIDGRRTVVEFHRQEKIDDLLSDIGSLGRFLRDMIHKETQE